MSWSYENTRRVLAWVGPIIGILAVGSLLYLHLAGVPVVPVDGHPSPSKIGVCTTAPDWAADSARLEKVGDFLAGLGYPVEVVVGVECNARCTGTYRDGAQKGKPFNVACVHGMTVVDLRDQDPAFTDAHAGNCLRPVNGTGPAWGVVRLPLELPEGNGDPLLPEAKDLVVAHELLHCVGAVGHTRTPMAGCAGAVKTGEIMHPYVAMKGGWGTAGLPRGAGAAEEEAPEDAAPTDSEGGEGAVPPTEEVPPAEEVSP